MQLKRGVMKVVVGAVLSLVSVGVLSDVCTPDGTVVDGPIVVFEDQLTTGWDTSWSWNAGKLIGPVPDVGQNGSSVFPAVYYDQWGGIEFHTYSPVSTVGKKLLSFSVYGREDTKLRIGIRRFDSGTVDTWVPSGSYTPWVEPTDPMVAEAWYHVLIPLEDLGVTDTIINGIVFMNIAPGEVYFDDVMILEGLAFPLHETGDGPFTTTVTAIMDHHYPTRYSNKDGVVTAYNGETGLVGFSCRAWSTTTNSFTACNESNYTSYTVVGFGKDDKDAELTEFNLGINYDSEVDPSPQSYLFSDGHTGYDYKKPNGTSVYPVAEGTVVSRNQGVDCDANNLVIRHKHGKFESHYLHFSEASVNVGDTVTMDQEIGKVGCGHLHYTVMVPIGGTTDGEYTTYDRIDPYGWLGVDPDPNSSNVISVPLWE